jgi:cellobiose-specific phosphotransferase system component IIC
LASGCVNNSVAQHVKHGYYAATSYADAQVWVGGAGGVRALRAALIKAESR